MDWVLDKVVDQSDCGSSLGNTKITDLVFADDAVIFAESMEVLVMALEALHEEVKHLGLEVSWLKTKVQVFGGLLDETVQSVHACGKDIEILENLHTLVAQSIMMAGHVKKSYAIHSLFKLLVVLILNPEKVDAVISRLLFEVTEQAVLDTSDGSSPDEDEEDDFFKRNKLLEQAMFPAPSHPAWVDVFVKYNTAIPSSAAVERLFSQGSDIMKAKRASLTSDNFEILVFMKGNMDLFNMELSPEDSK
ncbi:hypothetical protein GWK47_037303 [Chionoecetes opilio]|uniref:HAT C-terminal dimerisation domain-containing protein n=1 Tax=Chionoecetes opilio TaxID=41210 RepID=A0A8J5D2C0_CHIOP|nr:hypothetical protein GWK47_037303 [Chionoecetes opilio]